MKRKVRGLFILSILILSNTFILFQNSFLSPSTTLQNGVEEEGPPETDPIGIDETVDATNQGNDVHNLQNPVYFSKLYYKYKNTTLAQANMTIDYLINHLWDSSYHGFNDSDDVNAKKRTYDNMLLIITLLDYNDAESQPEYISFAENTFNFEYNYLWDNAAKLFRSYSDYTGENPSAQLNSTDNALAVLALLKLYDATNNQTYLEIANITYTAFDSLFYDSVYGGYYRSNLSGDTSKFAYDNLLVGQILTEIYKMECFSPEIQNITLERAESTADLLISHYLNGTLGLFSAGTRDWKNPVEDKNAEINALAIDLFISIYDITLNQTFYDLTLDIADFIDSAFWDSTGGNRGYNTTVNWDGSSIINSTKYLEVNSLIIKAYLQLFEKSYNSTHYLDAINTWDFLKTYLLDHENNAFNYSVDFTNPLSNSSLKSAADNAWVIQALLNFRAPRPYLTRANTTMTMVYQSMYSDAAFDNMVMFNWNPLSETVIVSAPLLTVADIIGVYQSTFGNIFVVYTLLKLAQVTGLGDYLTLSNLTMHSLYETAFSNAFVENASAEEHTYYTETNALGILALMKLYEETGDSSFLKKVNETWFFLKENLWDSNMQGYNTSTDDPFTKNLLGNCLMTWANLEIANSNSSIFDSIRINASLYANLTLNLINQFMWDPVNTAYYFNASADWAPITSGNTVKRTYENVIMIQTLLNYNQFYPNNSNKTIYDERINQTIRFLLDNLWDSDVGGFYYGAAENGTQQDTDKYVFGNNWAILALLKLYEVTGNFSYYLLSEECNNFINTYLWDLDYGGYFHSCSKDGVPYSMGRYFYGGSAILLSFKFLENQLSSILALSELSIVKRTLESPLIVDIEMEPGQLDRSPHELQISLKLIDTDGNPLNKMNVSISKSGLYETIIGVNFYGLAEKLGLQNEPGTNQVNTTVDISPYLGSFHLSILAYNSTMAATWFLITANRTFDVHLTKAFSIIHNINLLFKKDFGGLIRTEEGEKAYYAFDNWLAVLASLEYQEAVGINLFLNLTTLDLEQILFTIISNITNFLNTSLMYSPINESAIAFYTRIDAQTGVINPSINCTDTALAIITLLKYFQMTNDSSYLDMANKTWNFLNTTLWDPEYFGYKNVNGADGNQTKYTLDNIWAILADLAIYNMTQINSAIRASALNMANLTLNHLLNNLWDNTYLGFYSSFNGSSWAPNTNGTCKETIVNSLAIQMFVQFAEWVNNSKYETYLNYANQTFLFINNILKDQQLLGYFSASDQNGSELNTDKSLFDNSWMILALLDLYRVNNFNYSYYRLAEETIFFLDRYYKSTITTIYHSLASRYGAYTHDVFQKTPIESYSNFAFLRGLTETDLTRQNLKYPLVIENITFEEPELGEIQKLINVTVEIYDTDGNPVENASVLGVIYGLYKKFSFQQLVGNTYYAMVNITSLSGYHSMYFFACKEGYSTTFSEYVFTVKFPIYVQKSYETSVAYFLQFYSDIYRLYYNDKTDFPFQTFSNLLVIQANLGLKDVIGDILLIFDWFANKTLQSFSEIAVESLQLYLNSSPIQSDSQNVSGFVSEYKQFAGENLTTSASNAMAILTFLDLYERTGNLLYIELANTTWLYLNKTFWDPLFLGYKSDNSTGFTPKNIFDNCLAIWADLAINETLAINPSIRDQAFLLANITLSRINQSLWDENNGTYFYEGEADWSFPRGRDVVGNAVMIQTLLRFYNHDTNQTEYLHMANITGDLLIQYFYDNEYGGFFSYLLDNLSIPFDDPSISTDDIQKYTSNNAWAILALAELYSSTKNLTYYYMAEDTMNFVNSHLANHYNNYLNLGIGDVNGYWDVCNRSGFVYQKTLKQYPGTLGPSALMVQALLKLYTVANATLPWLNATVKLLPSVDYPPGDYFNVTISVTDKDGLKLNAELNITMTGWKRETNVVNQLVLQTLEYEYDPSTQEYKVKNVNLTGLEDIYITVYAKNTSYAIWWNAYYIHRVPTNLYLYGVGGDYIPSEDYWQYTIGEDAIIIEALYIDYSEFIEIPGATLNFTVYFPNATIWFSELIITNATGWGRLTFGPIPNLVELFGQYNITVFASHVNTTGSPITWYGSRSVTITINIDYGVSIPFFYPLESFVAQGDKIQCNVTVKHRMTANLSVDILIYSEGVLIPTLYETNLTTGLNYFLIEAEVDERTPIGFHTIYVNISFEDKVIRDTYFFITILSAALIRNYYTPTWISEDDVRYAVLEIDHRKRFETTNISVMIDCPALKEKPSTLVLEIFTQQEYYIQLEVKDNIPYGIYSGEIIVKHVNYTLTYEDEPLTFQIEVKPSAELLEVQVPSIMIQNQRSISSIHIQNNKISSINIKVIGHGDGFNNFEGEFSINPAELKVINAPILYYKNPWDSGLREYTIEIYYLNSSSMYSLISTKIFQIEIKYSLNNVLLGYVLPSLIIAIAVIYIFWYLDKKKRKRKKLK
ncbi:MAG: AGE family epimerase/isomerase [Candidatus Helarchaeota archaeon]